ncbi:MAG: hypothetical protein KAS23_07275 [Anaerohalosphaera sp.]|nr:hypothetical protein [Anaerohalosphaera sp.]
MSNGWVNGDTFFFSQSGQQQYPDIKNHLFFIVSYAEKYTDRVVIINITTQYGNIGEDYSCLVESCDHPWLNRTSYVSYKDAKIISLEYLLDLHGKGLIAKSEPASNDLWERLLDGAFKSRHTPNDVLDVLREQELE